jgi:hypothetical protein
MGSYWFDRYLYRANKERVILAPGVTGGLGAKRNTTNANLKVSFGFCDAIIFGHFLVANDHLPRKIGSGQTEGNLTQ